MNKIIASQINTRFESFLEIEEPLCDARPVEIVVGEQAVVDHRWEAPIGFGAPELPTALVLSIIVDDNCCLELALDEKSALDLMQRIQNQIIPALTP